MRLRANYMAEPAEGSLDAGTPLAFQHGPNRPICFTISFFRWTCLRTVLSRQWRSDDESLKPVRGRIRSNVVIQHVKPPSGIPLHRLRPHARVYCGLAMTWPSSPTRTVKRGSARFMNGRDNE